MAGTEGIFRSRLTLCSGRIEEIGQYLYVRFLKRRLIPEDLCADLYEQIVKRLKGYRDRNPEVKKVNRSFVNNCANWIVKNLCRTQKKSETREKSVIELLKNEVDIINKPSSAKLHARYENRILRVLYRQVRAGKLKRRHLLYYVLYHAAETRFPFALRLLKTAGLKTPENIRRLKRIRRHIAAKSRSRSELFLRILENKHSQVMDSQWALERAADPAAKKLAREKLARARQAQQTAYASLCQVRIVPSMRCLSAALGPAPSAISYGIRRVEEILKKEVTP
ncbi:MAG: hypothetical protein JW874_01965 [Spirochaetales bacterium]|nr:hypothetical protein [Spirochaetales bacterium]